jgi:hypothetical protein
MESDDQRSDEEIERLMKNAIRRALATPPKPAKELVGKSERALALRESRVRKATRSKPKSP